MSGLAWTHTSRRTGCKPVPLPQGVRSEVARASGLCQTELQHLRSCIWRMEREADHRQPPGVCHRERQVGGAVKRQRRQLDRHAQTEQLRPRRLQHGRSRITGAPVRKQDHLSACEGSCTGVHEMAALDGASSLRELGRRKMGDACRHMADLIEPASSARARSKGAWPTRSGRGFPPSTPTL